MITDQQQRHILKHIVREVAGIVGAIITWWALAVLIGLLISALFPGTNTFFEIEPQNIPGHGSGFIAALYAFRAVTVKRDRWDAQLPRRLPG